MANVIAQVIGGTPQQVSAETVGDLKRQLGIPNYKAVVNGEAKSDDTPLVDGNFVTLSPNVKGGQG